MESGSCSKGGEVLCWRWVTISSSHNVVLDLIIMEFACHVSTFIKMHLHVTPLQFPPTSIIRGCGIWLVMQDVMWATHDCLNLCFRHAIDDLIVVFDGNGVA